MIMMMMHYKEVRWKQTCVRDRGRNFEKTALDITSGIY